MLSPTDVSRDETRGTGPDRAEVLVALAAIALGLFVLFASFTIDLGTGYDRIGPRFFPFVVAAGLILSGSFLAKGALRRGNISSTEAPPQTNWPAVGTLATALGSSVLLLEAAGFIPTGALLFFLVARAFKSRRPWRDAVVGLLLSAFVYIAFTRGLGLALPQGLL